MKRTLVSRHPDKLISYWKMQLPLCIVICISGILYNFGMIAFPFFQGVMIDTIENGILDEILPIVFIYIGVIFLVQISRAIKRYTVRLFATKTTSSMRYNLYDNLLHKSEKELAETDIGNLLTRCFSDCNQCVEGMRKLTTEIFDTVVVFIIYIAYLFLYDYKMTLWSMIPVVIAIFIAFLFRKKVYDLSAQSRKLNSEMVSKTYDLYSNVMLYRTYSREKDIIADIDESLSKYEKKNITSLSLTDMMIPFCNLIALIGMIPIIYLGSGYVVNSVKLTAPLPFMKDTFTIGALSTFITTFVLVASKASHTAKLFSSIEKGLSSWKRIAPVITPIEDFNKPVSIEDDSSLVVNSLTLRTDTRVLIDNLSFSLTKGQILGVTGEIASGKSAFGKVFISDFTYEGSIKLFGKEMRDYKDNEIKGTVSYMGHQSQLMTMSIKDNVLYDKDDSINTYLNMVSFNKDLENMEEKENTIIGNEGVRLSGGQQERIALARTIAHKKSLIVLDDPFASVDKNTEKEILKSLSDIAKDSIIILISHRLTVFPELDKVMILHGDGKVSIGTHEELMNEDEQYHRLYSLQQKE